MGQNIHHAPTSPQVMATLYLGCNIPSGGMVSAERFADYLTHVTPHFPGFTVREVHGYWKGEPEMCRELVILATDSDGLRNQIRLFAEQYKTMFFQEAVGYSFAPCNFVMDCWPYGPVKAYHKEGRGY